MQTYNISPNVRVRSIDINQDIPTCRDSIFTELLNSKVPETSLKQLENLIEYILSEQYDTDSLIQDLQAEATSNILMRVESQEAINIITQVIQTIMRMFHSVTNLTLPLAKYYINSHISCV